MPPLKAFGVALVSALAGASVVHNLYKPDLTIPGYENEEEEENATVRTDVLLLPRQEGDVLEDVDADVVVDAYEVDALLAAQTNARLLVHARILCCVVMHGRLSSFVSVVGLMKNLYFFTNRKRRDKSASSHSCRNKN